MLNRALTIIVIGLIAMTTTLLGAAPASAAGTWTVTPGGRITISGGPLTIYSPTGTVVHRCSHWATDGQFQPGTGLPGAGVGAIMLSFFSFGCTGGFPISIQPNWPVNADSYRSSLNLVSGTITARMTTFDPTCRGISPVVPYVYSNNTGVLSSNRFGPVSTTSTQCTITLGNSTITPRQTITSP